MAGGKSTGRAAWAALLGVAIGAGLLAGVHEPSRAAPVDRDRAEHVQLQQRALAPARVTAGVRRATPAGG